MTREPKNGDSEWSRNPRNGAPWLGVIAVARLQYPPPPYPTGARKRDRPAKSDARELPGGIDRRQRARGGQAARHREGRLDGQGQSRKGRRRACEGDPDQGRAGVPEETPEPQIEGEDKPPVHPQEGRQVDDERHRPDRLIQVLSAAPRPLWGVAREVPINGALIPLRAGSLPSGAAAVPYLAAAPFFRACCAVWALHSIHGADPH